MVGFTRILCQKIWSDLKSQTNGKTSQQRDIGGSKIYSLVLSGEGVEDMQRLYHETQQQRGMLPTIQPATDSLSNQTAQVSASAKKQ